MPAMPQFINGITDDGQIPWARIIDADDDLEIEVQLHDRKVTVFSREGENSEWKVVLFEKEVENEDPDA